MYFRAPGECGRSLHFIDISFPLNWTMRLLLFQSYSDQSFSLSSLYCVLIPCACSSDQSNNRFCRANWFVQVFCSLLSLIEAIVYIWIITRTGLTHHILVSSTRILYSLCQRKMVRIKRLLQSHLKRLWRSCSIHVRPIRANWQNFWNKGTNICVWTIH